MLQASRHDGMTAAVKVRAQSICRGAHTVMRADVRWHQVGHENRGNIKHHNNLFAIGAHFGLRGRNLVFDGRNLVFGVRNLVFSGRNLVFQNVTSVTNSTPLRTYVDDRGYEPDFAYPLRVRAREHKSAGYRSSGKITSCNL